MTTALQPPQRMQFVTARGVEWPISYTVEDTDDNGGTVAVLDMVLLNDRWFFAVDVLSDDLYNAIENSLNNP